MTTGNHMEEKRFTDVFVKRPVLAIVISMALNDMGGLDFLDPFRVACRESVHQFIQRFFHRWGQRGEFADRAVVRHRLQPADLNQHATADQTVFAEDLAQAVDLVGVAAVRWG